MTLGYRTAVFGPRKRVFGENRAAGGPFGPPAAENIVSARTVAGELVVPRQTPSSSLHPLRTR